MKDVDKISRLKSLPEKKKIRGHNNFMQREPGAGIPSKMFLFKFHVSLFRKLNPKAIQSQPKLFISDLEFQVRGGGNRKKRQKAGKPQTTE